MAESEYEKYGSMGYSIKHSNIVGEPADKECLTSIACAAMEFYENPGAARRDDYWDWWFACHTSEWPS